MDLNKPFTVSTKKGFFNNTHSIKYLSPSSGTEINVMQVPGKIDNAEHLASTLNWAYAQGHINSIAIQLK